MTTVTEIAKIALLSFLSLAVLTIAVTYVRRRRAGVRSWRPDNSRIIGYDATIPQIERPASRPDGPDRPRHGREPEPPE